MEEWQLTFAGSSAAAALALSPVAGVLIARHLRHTSPLPRPAAASGEVQGAELAGAGAVEGPLEDLPSPRGLRLLERGGVAAIRLGWEASSTASAPPAAIVSVSIASGAVEEESDQMRLGEEEGAALPAAPAVAIEGGAGGSREVEVEEYGAPVPAAAAAAARF